MLKAALVVVADPPEVQAMVTVLMKSGQNVKPEEMHGSHRVGMAMAAASEAQELTEIMTETGTTTGKEIETEGVIGMATVNVPEKETATGIGTETEIVIEIVTASAIGTVTEIATEIGIDETTKTATAMAGKSEKHLLALPPLQRLHLLLTTVVCLQGLAIVVPHMQKILLARDGEQQRMRCAPFILI